MLYTTPLTLRTLIFLSLYVILVAGCSMLKSTGLDKKIPGSNLVEKYMSKQPITTNFDSAHSEVELSRNFEPTEGQFRPLSSLDRNEEGHYIVSPGLYTANVKSFCLHAGTYNPSKGDGYLFATLSGPKAALIRAILENWQVKHPKIPQTEIQKLIWAIIARVNIREMAPVHKITLLEVLTPAQILEFSKDAMISGLADKLMTNLQQQIPAAIANILEAEKNLRSLYAKAESTYAEFEKYAVLAGMAPAATKVRDISKGRWSYHPNGYFIRFYPSNYTLTRVDVYKPSPCEILRERSGRIARIVVNDRRMLELAYDPANEKVLRTIRLSGFEGLDTTVSLRRGIMIDFFNVPERPSPKTSLVTLASYTAGRSESTTNTLIPQTSATAMIASLQNIGDAVSGNGSNINSKLSTAINGVLNESINSTMLSSLGSANPGNSKLDLPSMVATPANTAHQRLGLTDPPPPECSVTVKQIVNEVPDIMHRNGWTNGEKLMKIWMSRPPNSNPKDGEPVKDLIKMDWVLSYLAIRSLYEKQLAEKTWMNAAARISMANQIEKMAEDRFITLPTNIGESVDFNTLSLEMSPFKEPIAERYYFQRADYNDMSLAINDETAALARFSFHFAMAGKIIRQKDFFELQITKVGIFVKDSYDFIDLPGEDQRLGCWNSQTGNVSPFNISALGCEPLHNSDFRNWRICNNKGGDFYIYSDMRVTTVKATIQIPLWFNHLIAMNRRGVDTGINFASRPI